MEKKLSIEKELMRELLKAIAAYDIFPENSKSITDEIQDKLHKAMSDVSIYIDTPTEQEKEAKAFESLNEAWGDDADGQYKALYDRTVKRQSDREWDKMEEKFLDEHKMTAKDMVTVFSVFDWLKEVKKESHE